MNIKKRVEDVEELMNMIDKDENPIDIADIMRLSVNSLKEINWKCGNNHTFKEKIKVMYRRKHKCFYCLGRQIWVGENDLKSLFPELAKEFDVEKNGITADIVSPKDTTSYWWKCGNNHPSFQQSVEHRVNRKTKCPYCSGRRAISGVNDLETLFPDIAKEWDYKKNNGVLPRDVSPYTYTSYFWVCPKGHSYRRKVILRTKYHRPIDCTKCVKASSTSFPEQAIYYYAKKCFPDALNRYKEPFENGMELDIYIPKYQIGIEYDGVTFHSDDEQHKREQKKYRICQQHGIKLIRIKESMNTWNDTSDEVFYVEKRMSDSELQDFLWFMFSNVFGLLKYSFRDNEKNSKQAVLNHFNGFPTDFNVARDRAEILEYLVDIENSFGIQHPELAKMWSEKDNGELTPYMFMPGSNYQATWKCALCGNTWKSPIVSIVSRKARCCKQCSSKIRGKRITKTKTTKGGSLAEKSNILLKQWDYEENSGISPYDIPLNYSFEVAWKCDKCGYKWTSSPNSRVRKNQISGCPHCTGRVPMAGVDDFETLYPDISSEWDYEKNSMIPSQIKPNTNKKFYWICPVHGESYLAYPVSRTKGSGCPQCSRESISKKNSKKVGQFDDDGKMVNSYFGLHEAARDMQVVPNAIFQAVKNGKKSKGYYWRYISDNES